LGSLSLYDIQKALAKTKRKKKISYVLRGPASGARSLFLLHCFPIIQGPALWPGWLGLGVWQSCAPSPSRSAYSSLARSWGDGRSAPTGPWLVSYHLREVLGSLWCGCGQNIVLCPVVFILGGVVFVIFSLIYVVLGGDFHCSTHATIFRPSPMCHALD